MFIFSTIKKRREERKNNLRDTNLLHLSFLYFFSYFILPTIFSLSFLFLLFFLLSHFFLIFLLFFFSTIAWSTICWQCTTRLPFARTTIPSGAGCGCIQVMNNILELSVKKKTNNDTIFTAGSRRNCHDTRKRLLRIRKCLSNT